MDSEVGKTVKSMDSEVGKTVRYSKKCALFVSLSLCYLNRNGVIEYKCCTYRRRKL